jgi:hypothetical protein
MITYHLKETDELYPYHKLENCSLVDSTTQGEACLVDWEIQTTIASGPKQEMMTAFNMQTDADQYEDSLWANLE